MGVLDDLQYTYSGNRLKNVTDLGNASGIYDSYKDGVSQSQEYFYNTNGALTGDLNKGISMTYSWLDLPTAIDMGAGKKTDLFVRCCGLEIVGRGD